jgi:hypothetical protein
MLSDQNQETQIGYRCLRLGRGFVPRKISDQTLRKVLELVCDLMVFFLA